MRYVRSSTVTERVSVTDPPPRTENPLDRETPSPNRDPPGQRPPPPRGRTNASENITLPSSNFVSGGKKIKRNLFTTSSVTTNSHSQLVKVFLNMKFL